MNFDPASDPTGLAMPPTLNGPSFWGSSFPVPQPDGNKYSRGHALVHGGPLMTGAARLGSRAAQRIGAGLVTLAAATSAWPIYAASLESVIVRPCDDLKGWKELLDDEKKRAVLLGPGLGTGAATQSLVLAALASNKPCVLDADALTSFASTPARLFSALHGEAVLTPHEGEFLRLFGTSVDKDADKATRAREAAKAAGCVVLLKGNRTIIATPSGETIQNDNGSPYLATGGSGDVLSGLILGLLAQGMPAVRAAAAGAWIHGALAAKLGAGLIAEDLVDVIPHVLKDLSGVLSIV